MYWLYVVCACGFLCVCVCGCVVDGDARHRGSHTAQEIRVVIKSRHVVPDPELAARHTDEAQPESTPHAPMMHTLHVHV